MSPSTAVPGKVFLIGEYSVLAGLPAYVAAVGPAFSLERADSILFDPHPQSPAGRLLSATGHERGVPGFQLHPTDGKGFGSSTAEFILAAKLLGLDASPEALWARYRELTVSESAIRPSGADLIAQLIGGIARVQIVAGDLSYRQERERWVDVSLVYFSAAGQEGRKVATHLHLGDRGLASVLSEEFFLTQARAILENPLWERPKLDAAEVARAFEMYGDVLARFGLEIPETREDRAAIRGVRGVLGVKGCGALQADALVAVVDRTQLAWPDLEVIAQKRSLRILDI